MREESISRLVELRATRPDAVAEAAAARQRPASFLGEHGRLMMIAADHPARGALRAGGDALAMGDRTELLDRLCVALERPGVNGVLGTADVLDDLLLLGALDGKVVVGSMNRGGLAGSVFEMDDRFTAMDATSIAAAGYQGGKMLTRIDLTDSLTARTLQASADAVSDLARHDLMAMVEPFMSSRIDGVVKNQLTADAMVLAVGIASGLGSSSAHTWLKLPVVDDMERVCAASTMPALILGGEVGADQDAAFAGWEKALALPTVKGLVIGRSLLFPPGDDVAAAVDTAVGLL
jgi:hypothetical protein